MTGNQLARESKSRLIKGGTRLLGPLGVFMRGFLAHPQMVGALFPSSRSTVDAMLARVDWANCRLFVEYGPGVGTFTLPVLDRLPPGGKLLAIDTNPALVEHRRRTIEDARFRVVLGSAADVEAIVGAGRHEGADHVLSGLPISTIPESVADAIVAASYRVLKPGGSFMTYQYRKLARELTEKHFQRVDRSIVWSNIPPNQLAWGWK